MKTLKLSIPGAGFKPNLSQYIDFQDPIFSRWDIRVNDGCTKADAWFIIEDVIENDNHCAVPRDKIFLEVQKLLRKSAIYTIDQKCSYSKTNFLNFILFTNHIYKMLNQIFHFYLG